MFLFEGVGLDIKKNIFLLNETALIELKKYCEIVKSKFNINLWDYINDNLEEEKKTKFYDWILIYTCDYIIYNQCIEREICAELFMGYSMGLITAITCAGAIDYVTGIKLLSEIYIYPVEVNRSDEAMATIIGLEYGDIEEIIKEVSLEEDVAIASENSDYCIVIAGRKNSVLEIMELAEERDAIKVLLLDLPYAFHTDYALIGIKRVQEFINSMRINDSNTKIMSIYSQSIIQKAEDIKIELIKNIYSSMKWKESILKVKEYGMKNYIEISLGDSLSRISKVIDLDNKFITFSEINI